MTSNLNSLVSSDKNRKKKVYESENSEDGMRIFVEWMDGCLTVKLSVYQVYVYVCILKKFYEHALFDFETLTYSGKFSEKLAEKFGVNFENTSFTYFTYAKTWDRLDKKNSHRDDNTNSAISTTKRTYH
ncbi:hypothetical protein LOAG_00578 [Loa loa]|uniref:Uncharacterized protein n=1 Tax=Loa loa TaxID=7209 RepID=A0A1S0UBD4_LOALO|nr:hypothetical protein LOAG_00578 [Loa loa]EFO27898.1 hypothetical protein LOAG_00578 [Loa loa]